MQSLQDRRRQTDMVETFQIMDSDVSDPFFIRSGTRSASHITCGTNNIVPERTNHEYRSYFFSGGRSEQSTRQCKGVKNSADLRRYRRHTGHNGASPGVKTQEDAAKI